MTFVVREYVDASGRIPFRDWLGGLDLRTRARVQARIFRFETGNLGDHKEVGGGVWEARLDFGPGYRLYFGRRGRELVLLLTGGDKKSQKKDLRRAREFWCDYLVPCLQDTAQNWQCVFWVRLGALAAELDGFVPFEAVEFCGESRRQDTSGADAWQDAVEIGTRVWPETSRTRSSRASS